MDHNGGVSATPHDPDDERRVRADGSVSWLEETVVEKRETARGEARQGSVLAAAMIAVGEILEPEKTRVDIEIQAEAPADEPYDLPFAIGFGNLPELS